MKAIMISIQPKWVKKILMGEKTIEIRKTMPKCELPIDVYIYCTKSQGKKNYLSMIKTDLSNDAKYEDTLNGKVVAKFTLNKVEEIGCYYDDDMRTTVFFTDDCGDAGLLKRSCLTEEQIADYFADKEDNVVGYAWHIEDLFIFFKPKELSEFYTIHLDKTIPELFDNSTQLPNGVWVKPLTKPFQSWGYIEV